MKGLKKIMSMITHPEENKKLKKWQSKLDIAKLAYSDELGEMTTREGYYNGMREMQGNPNSNKPSTKKAINVRNIAYELVESQVDSSIPMPKITPIHEEDIEAAKKIEKALVNEIKRLKLNTLNDLQERITPIQGGDFFHVEWDSKAGLHSTLGAISISERHPKQIIPQPGVTDTNKMDYLFVLLSQTKDFIKTKYGIDVSDAKKDNADLPDRDSTDYSNDIVTINMAYYKNGQGGIGLFSWVDDYVLEDMTDYYARKLERCVKCNAVKDGDVCECGSKKFKQVAEEEEELVEDIVISEGEIVPAEVEEYGVASDELGNPVIDENTGEQVVVAEVKKQKVPYYKINKFSLVLRKNVSKNGKLLGYSDVDMIQDQQDTIKKLGSKINEKILKGGSYVTLPAGVGISTTDEELKIIRLDNPNQKAMIDVITVQADIGQDRIMLAENYEWAKSTLGITDAYQGKYDSSATSGTAKQYSINQAAGRLESKRVMKNEAYSNLYELIFKFWLAYADQPLPISSPGMDGQPEFDEFNRYEFLKRDAAGELYWNDEFLFETDPTSTIMTNREAMWQQADMKLQSGAFGPIGEPDTLIAYWKYQERNNYPNAADMRKDFEERKRIITEQNAVQGQLEQLLQEGGGNNAMPVM